MYFSIFDKHLNLKKNCFNGNQRAIKKFNKGIFEIINYGEPRFDNLEFEKYLTNFRFEQYSIKTEYVGCSIDEETICYSNKMQELIKNKFGMNFFKNSRYEALKKYPNRVFDKIKNNEIIQKTDLDSLPKYIYKGLSLKKYLQNEFNDIIDLKKGSNIYAVFVVEKNGDISNVKIRSRKPSIKDSVLRQKVKYVILNMPKWKPGYYKDKKVRSTTYIPIIIN